MTCYRISIGHIRQRNRQQRDLVTCTKYL